MDGGAMVEAIEQVGVTHVVWLPDSMLGTWETPLAASRSLTLVRVCREGEAWAIAAGLMIGGKQPLVVMQSTGFFESGDAMRNALFDLQLPLYTIVGYRSYLLSESKDTAKQFMEPVLRGWGLDYKLIDKPDPAAFAAHYRACREACRPGIALIAEGKG
jgi:sulfopyruvate decarboxylase TPP-binding subunit